MSLEFLIRPNPKDPKSETKIPNYHLHKKKKKTLTIGLFINHRSFTVHKSPPPLILHLPVAGGGSPLHFAPSPHVATPSNICTSLCSNHQAPLHRTLLRSENVRFFFVFDYKIDIEAVSIDYFILLLLRPILLMR